MLAEADRIKMEITPTSAEQARQAAAAIVETDATTIAIAKRLIEGDGK